MSSTTVATNLTARRDGETYRFDHPSMTDIIHLVSSAADRNSEWRLQELAELLWTHSSGPKDRAQSASVQRPVVRHNHLRERVIAPQDHVAAHLPD
ncbi:MAG: hypothetical protein SGI92_12365 [Bryobacteraceae bacterium]|nr:hypothetical protein [Bryobacteraceae bacterium]